MNIIRTDIDAVNAMLTLQVTEADYAEKVEKALKSYRQKANIPGFRPGMAPMGLVKKCTVVV
jgi:trigger factor